VGLVNRDTATHVSTCYVRSSNPVRAVDVFVDELDLGNLGFGGVEPEADRKAGLPSGDQAKMQRRVSQVDESIARYLSQLDSADRQEVLMAGATA
jgi:hypothetical protein